MPRHLHAIFFATSHVLTRGQHRDHRARRRALVPGGFLFLGYAETLRGLSTAFHLRHSRETFYYQKRDDAAPPLQARPVDAFVRDAPEGRDSGQPSRPSSRWYETIGDASQRIRTLTEEPATDAPRAAQRDSGFDLGATFDLLRKERYGDALDAMQVCPRRGARSRCALLRCACWSTASSFTRRVRLHDAARAR